VNRLLGLETEYGLAVEGKEAWDLVEEAVLLLEALPEPCVRKWDYSLEDPRRDLRGFRVDRLTPHPADLELDKKARCPSTAASAIADRVLPNGARLYNDHGHPEYSTAECRSLRDLVAQERVGERILLECAAALSEEKITLYRNNTDYHGFSYGCHENYLVRRDLPVEALIQGIIPFLVTRQIYAGAGKVVVEGEKGALEPLYQLSQRADFLTDVVSLETLYHRPVVNTRDEPHADPRRYRRFHVILGDSNMSQYATALKVGTTALVLSVLESGWSPPFALKDPLAATREISRDQSLQWKVRLSEGRTTTAVEVQRRYWEAACKTLAHPDDDEQWVLEQWDLVLQRLAKDALSLSDRLDWAIKQRMLDTFIQAESREPDLNLMQSLDLEYHNCDPQRGLFYALENQGDVLALVGEEEIAAARTRPPQDTRAFLRGWCVGRFPEAVECACWRHVCLRGERERTVIDLTSLVDGWSAELNARVEAARTVEEFIKATRGNA